MRTTTVGVLVCGVLLLGGCSSGPDRKLQQATAEVIDSANGEDAVELRAAADRLIDLVDHQQDDGRLEQDQAARIRALAGNVRSEADGRIVAEVTTSRTAEPAGEPTIGSDEGKTGAGSEGGADSGKTAADLAAERADARKAAADRAAGEQSDKAAQKAAERRAAEEKDAKAKDERGEDDDD